MEAAGKRINALRLITYISGRKNEDGKVYLWPSD